MRHRLGGILAFVALTGLALACFGRLAAAPDALIVDPDRPSLDDSRRGAIPTIGNDLTRLFLPHHRSLADQAARTGRFPTWDPAGFGGRPAVGNPQGGLFYPPAWIAWRWRSPSALCWITVGHLVVGGFGTYLLGRTSGMGLFASLVASGCFQASPYVLAQAFEGHHPHVWAACWFPWAFAAALQLRRGGRSGPPALALVMALAYLTGHPQEWHYLACTLGAWAAFDVATQFRGGRPREAYELAIRWGMGLGLGLALVGAELVPVLAGQDSTLRHARLTLKEASRYHWSPINLLQLLGPRALGGPSDYFGHDNYWETIISIGLAPLVLASIGAVRSPDRRSVRGWLALTLAALAFAAGRRLGLFALAYELVPGMDRFRVPGRALFLATLGAAMLVGHGVEALLRGAGPAESWRKLGRRGLLVAAVLVVGLGWGEWTARRMVARPSPSSRPTIAGAVPTRHPERRPRLNRRREQLRWALGAGRLARDLRFWFALAGSLAALDLASRGPSGRRRAAVALGVLAWAELGCYGYSILRVAPPGRFLGPDPIGDAIDIARDPRPDAGPVRIRADDDLYDDARAFARGYEKANIYDSYQIQRAANLYQTLYPIFRDDPADASPEARVRRATRQAVLDRMAISFIVGPRAGLDPAWPLIATGLRDGRPYAVHRNPTALPRAYVVPRSHPAPTHSEAVLEAFRRVDPRQAVLLSAPDPLPPVGPRQPFTPADYDASDPALLVIRTANAAPGLLVIADTWMPGWTARVDGRPAPILLGNHAQRVIPLPDPGRHEIVLEYRPPGFALGLTITELASIAWLALATRALRRRIELIPRRDEWGTACNRDAGVRERAERLTVAGTS